MAHGKNAAINGGHYNREYEGRRPNFWIRSRWAKKMTARIERRNDKNICRKKNI
jgi:hypothetical protein